jgi:hypothetical protein
VTKYLLAVVAAALALAVGAALYYRGSAANAAAAAAQARSELAQAVDANRAQQEAIGRLRASEAAASKLTDDLLAKIDTINHNLAEANSALADLRVKDASVRDYLDTPVPDALRRLYDSSARSGRQDRRGQGEGAGGADQTMSTGLQKANHDNRGICRAGRPQRRRSRHLQRASGRNSRLGQRKVKGN